MPSELGRWGTPPRRSPPDLYPCAGSRSSGGFVAARTNRCGSARLDGDAREAIVLPVARAQLGRCPSRPLGAAIEVRRRSTSSCVRVGGAYLPSLSWVL